MAQILRTSPELWMLDISATGVQDQDMTEELMDAFSRHTSVTSLYMHDHALTPGAIDRLGRVLAPGGLFT